MKKKIFFAMLFSTITLQSVLADICTYVAQDTADKAVRYLQHINEVVYYCPTCPKSEHKNRIILKNISAEKVSDKYWQVLSEGENLDLAYLYLPTEGKEKYRNLGYILHCADFENTFINEYLDINHPYGIERVIEFAKQLEKCGSQTCINDVYQNILHQFGNKKYIKQIGLPQNTSLITKQDIADMLVEIGEIYGVR